MRRMEGDSLSNPKHTIRTAKGLLTASPSVSPLQIEFPSTFIIVIQAHRRVHIPIKIDPHRTIRDVLEHIFNLKGVSRMFASLRIRERSSFGFIVEPNISACHELDASSRRDNALSVLNRSNTPPVLYCCQLSRFDGNIRGDSGKAIIRCVDKFAMGLE